MTKTATRKTKTAAWTADKAFTTSCDRFDALMARLQALRAANFNADETPDWGDVGSVGHVNAMLMQALEHYGA